MYSGDEGAASGVLVHSKKTSCYQTVFSRLLVEEHQGEILYCYYYC
jgi:hypothetical protein